MAKETKTSKGNRVLVFNCADGKRAGFGACMEDDGEHLMVCGGCNGEIKDDEDCYFVGSLNEIFCEECMKNSIDHMKHYADDEEFENEKMDMAKGLLEGVRLGLHDRQNKKNLFVQSLDDFGSPIHTSDGCLVWWDNAKGKFVCAANGERAEWILAHLEDWVFSIFSHEVLSELDSLAWDAIIKDPRIITTVMEIEDRNFSGLEIIKKGEPMLEDLEE